MKRNLFGLAAVVLAIAVSSFTTKWNTTYYMVYNSGSQNSMASYQAPTSTAVGSVFGEDILAWISIESVDTQIDNAEFLAAFAVLDESTTQVNNLNDEDEKDRTFSYSNQSGLHAILEKKEQ